MKMKFQTEFHMISLSVGQGGNQVSSAFWSDIAQEYVGETQEEKTRKQGRGRGEEELRVQAGKQKEIKHNQPVVEMNLATGKIKTLASDLATAMPSHRLFVVFFCLQNAFSFMKLLSSKKNYFSSRLAETQP